MKTATSDIVIDRMVKPISAEPYERRSSIGSPILDVADDVLEHHDGVVDDEAHRERERHEREIVEL